MQFFHYKKLYENTEIKDLPTETSDGHLVSSSYVTSIDQHHIIHLIAQVTLW